MGQYKVPQNVEAEDHIIGPLTFRQFVYAMIGFGWAVVMFALFRKLPALLIFFGFPPTMLFLLLAFYTRDGQNFEQILLSMVEFFAAPRKRLWVKEDVAETFHIEPAKHIAEVTQRNPAEVISELEKLSVLIDQRGWNKPSEPQAISPGQSLPSMKHEDRIVQPPPAPHAPDEPKADMLDLQHSPLASNLAELLRTAAEDVREEAMNQMSTRPTKRTALANAEASISGVTRDQSGDILKFATQSDGLSVSQVQAQANRIAPMPGAVQQTVELQQGAS